MSAEVLPFPRAMDRGYVTRQASYAASLRREKAAAHLRRQIELQRATMLKRGIAPERVEIEIERLEQALVAATRRYGLTLAGGGAA